MNRPIVRLYALVVLLFALLVAFTSRWTVFEASTLRDNHFNVRKLLEQKRIERGEITTEDGTVLARSKPAGEGTYERIYPTRELFSNAIGYAFVETGQTGLETDRDHLLSGETQEYVQAILDQLQGKRRQGDNVITTLDPKAQLVAAKALAGHEGAVVALDPRSGAVKVMASSPGFDPNRASSLSGLKQLNASAGSPLVNRATQFGYAPGSSFKIVTATAAIDTGSFSPSSTLSGRNGIVVSGVPLNNDNNETFGQITLTEALAHSVNTVWAQVAEQLGKQTLARYMERFGFDHKPRLDYPSSEMSSSGEYLAGRLIRPTSPEVDVGRMGIGQDKLQVTPLQMAEVAAAVADRGRLMAPHLTQKIVDPEGRIVEQISPSVQAVVMKPSTASAVTQMMEAVVKEGTGTSAQIPGVAVAGKTGTAETQIGAAINNVWFIAFAPTSAPRVAIAVTLKGVPGQGASFAAPVAREVMEVLLHD
ncbi:MAG TPA: penicillin-binding protein 2 [Solirubrobacteraceae bacterium]|jgi:peptidoglycan glycosyltransferase